MGKDKKLGVIDQIINMIKARKLRKQETTELVVMIEDLDQKLKLQINKAVTKIEELSQEKLYFMYVEVNDKELAHLKQEFGLIKRMMKWSAPNILILNRPLIELSEDKLKELETTRKKLRGVKNG